ncbi:monocarboxylate transporter 10 isoform X2 [Phymastichus coffea]|nr:monocarboxylate transporter 10 isoform X2 [Phymastichus coffea]XP_058798137.1 monocarboxylate transporter 10 isoform X2 [Phymastichus coffea]
MTTADLLDVDGDGEKNGHREATLLGEDEASRDDKKPVIVGSRATQENGRAVSMSIDATSKAQEANGSRRSPNEPPDGGLRAWSIMLGSFVINGVLFSIINSYSLIYTELQQRLKSAGEDEASTKAALVGSLTIGATFFLSPISGILTDKIGIQLTTFLGGALTASGMYISSLIADNVVCLYLTYGVIYGVGASLSYTPSLVILGHYFKRRLGLVNGIVTAGSSVFTTILPYLMGYLLKNYGLEGTFRSLAVLCGAVMLAAILFKPIQSAALSPDESQVIERKKRFVDMIKELINKSIWKRKKYVVWACAIPIALFGYFVPYVHIGKFVRVNFPESDDKIPVMCIGITSGIGRLIFGYIADLPRVNRILLQQISFVSIGILTMMLPFTTSFPCLVAILLGMGLFDGCFISLLGPIAFDICGEKGASQAIGFLLGLCSVPLTVGPPVAGMIYDHTQSYRLPFLLAGVPPIMGALAMMLVYRVRDQAAKALDEEVAVQAKQFIADPLSQNGCRQVCFRDDQQPNDECSPLLNDRQTRFRHLDDSIWNL